MTIESYSEAIVADRPKALSKTQSHYCPGCLHGLAHRLIAEVLDELAIRGTTLMVAPVGCAVFASNYFECDSVVAPHGRAPAVATGLKRVSPDKIVFAYQGDGDLASIGTAEIIHAAARGESITVIFINNAVYGMTGGQMAPTSLVGMKTTSSPFGRDVKTMGSPLKMSELIAGIDGATFVSRRSMHNPAEIRKAKKAIRRAFEVQINHQGFSLVELLSNCPTNWQMTPLESLRWIETRMVPVFPLGDLKNAAANNGLKGV